MVDLMMDPEISFKIKQGGIYDSYLKEECECPAACSLAKHVLPHQLS